MTKQIVVFDYGFGNVRSAVRAFSTTGAQVLLTSNVETALNCDGLVVPGVGAFDACMNGLRRSGGAEVIMQRAKAGRAIFGICVGMQVLFESSEEKFSADGESTAVLPTDSAQVNAGLGLLPGIVRRIDVKPLPHMGWNTLSPSFSLAGGDLKQQRYYFVHSYAATPSQALSEYCDEVAVTNHNGYQFVSAVRKGSGKNCIVGTQFHPEKSSTAGLDLINNWVSQL
jgi:glutamine amidotransferase